jgi:hypothetical protein
MRKISVGFSFAVVIWVFSFLVSPCSLLPSLSPLPAAREEDGEGMRGDGGTGEEKVRMEE